VENLQEMINKQNRDKDSLLRQIERMGDDIDVLRRESADRKELKSSNDEMKKKLDALQSNHDLLLEEKDNFYSKIVEETINDGLKWELMKYKIGMYYKLLMLQFQLIRLRV
jgi:hypothetical protein